MIQLKGEEINNIVDGGFNNYRFLTIWSDSNNYNPIAIATITSKVLESVLLVKCEEFLYTSDNQFGFKLGHSTEICIYTLQEYIEFYKRRNSTVFVTFLDASKAFDRINHWRLFTKLIDTHVPLFVIKL